MEIKKEKEGNTLTISLLGRLDSTNAKELEDIVLEDTDGIFNLIFDLKELKYTSSAGLRIFLKAQKIMIKQGTMEVINVCDDVYDIFDINNVAKTCHFKNIINIITYINYFHCSLLNHYFLCF